VIRVGVPYYDNYEPARPGLESLDGDKRFEKAYCRGTLIDTARNFIVTGQFCTLKKQEIVDRDFLFIDSDIIFTKADVEHIIALGKDNPVVFLPYKTHANPKEYQCGNWGKYIGVSGMRYPTSSIGRHLIDWCGAGFLFVKREVFQAIEYPYFRYYILDLGEHAVPVGEDFGFCIQLHRAGIPILCDFNHPIGHKQRKKAFYDNSTNNPRIPSTKDEHREGSGDDKSESEQCGIVDHNARG